MTTDDPTRPGLRLAVQTVAAAVAVGWLHGLRGRSWARLRLGDPIGWMLDQPADAIMALARLGALATGGWFVVSVVVCAAVTLLRDGARVRAPSWLTLPATRRLVEAALATSAVSSLVAGAVPVAAQPAAGIPPPDVAIPGTAAPDVTTPVGRPPPPGIVPPAATRAADPSAADPGPSAPTSRDAPPAAPADRHRVRAGESLWRIAADRIAGTPDRSGPEATARYWRRLVAANADRLRSDDPDLIFPGETVLLPELP